MDVVTRLASDNYYHIAFCRTSLLSAELPSSSHKYSAMKQISEVTYLVSWFLVSCRMTTTPFNCGILGKWPTWRTIFYVFIYIFNCLHVSSTTCSSSGETNCVITTSGSCRWPSRVQVVTTCTRSCDSTVLLWYYCVTMILLCYSDITVLLWYYCVTMMLLCYYDTAVLLW